jgi:hypothetical protein
MQMILSLNQADADLKAIPVPNQKLKKFQVYGP